MQANRGPSVSLLGPHVDHAFIHCFAAAAGFTLHTSILSYYFILSFMVNGFYVNYYSPTSYTNHTHSCMYITWYASHSSHLSFLGLFLSFTYRLIGILWLLDFFWTEAFVLYMLDYRVDRISGIQFIPHFHFYYPRVYWKVETR